MDEEEIEKTMSDLLKKGDRLIQQAKLDRLERVATAIYAADQTLHRRAHPRLAVASAEALIAEIDARFAEEGSGDEG